jgi:protein kinase A
VTLESNGKNAPTPYALKIVGKRQVLEQKMVRSIMSEKNIMESCVHPFLMNMVSSFQDENNLYFVLDLYLGGELFDVIYSSDKSQLDNKSWKASKFYESFGSEDEQKALKRYGTAGLGVRQAVFYSACIIDGLTYLHNRRVAYRDLKPENVLINEKGYCVIIDYGFAKIVLDKTFTMCGTPEYIAPEIIASKGHDHVADYWSFACILYEMIVGRTPFFIKKGQDHLSLLKRIFKAQYTFPEKLAALRGSNGSGLNDALCHWKDLISRLLKSKPVERLGNFRNGVDDILEHDWFARIDFNSFRNQSEPAPYVPGVGDLLDKSLGRDMFKTEVIKYKLTDEEQAAFVGF